MKKKFLTSIIVLFINPVFAQRAAFLKLSDRNLVYMKMSNISKFSFYEDDDLNKTYGYYSNLDSCFYKCNGTLLTKIKPEKIFECDNCCPNKDDITVDFSKLNQNSEWNLKGIIYLGKVNNEHYFRNKDSVTFYIETDAKVSGKFGNDVLLGIKKDDIYDLNIFKKEFQNANKIPERKF